MSESTVEEQVAAYQAKVAALKKRVKPGTDIWLYGDEAYCIHCVQSISLEAAMVNNAVKKGTIEYIGGPGNYAERLSAAEIHAWTREMAAEGLGPCECPELKPVAPTEAA